MYIQSEDMKKATHASLVQQELTFAAYSKLRHEAMRELSYALFYFQEDMEYKDQEKLVKLIEAHWPMTAAGYLALKNDKVACKLVRETVVEPMRKEFEAEATKHSARALRFILDELRLG